MYIVVKVVKHVDRILCYIKKLKWLNIPENALCSADIVLLGRISRRWDVGIWTGLGWHRIETGGGLL